MRVIIAVALVSLLATAAAAQTSVALPEGHEFTNPDHHPFAISPDGSTIAYLARATLFIEPVNGGVPFLVPGPLQGRGKTNPVFSPDGQSLLYWANDDSVLQRVPVRGGTPATLATVEMPSGLSWGDDGQILVGQGVKGIVRVSATGGPAQTVISMNAGEAAHGPQLLPGGDAILFTLGRGTPVDWDQAQIVAQSIRSGTRTVVASGRDARYLASGHLVYVTGTTVMAARFDVRALKTTTPPVVIANDVQTFRTSGAALFSVAANGALASVGTAAAPVSLALVDLEGKRQLLGEVPPGTQAPRISVDASKVTFAAAGDIYVADVGNVAAARKVIANGTFPLFSPDGQWLAFGSLGTRREHGEEVLFLQRADGSGDAEVIAKPARAPEHWPQGDQFTFITHRGSANNYDLWVYSVQHKEVEPLVVINESAQLSSSFSPDHKWIAYMSTESGDWQVYVQPYPATGMKYQVTTSGGRSPMWAGANRLVFDNDGQMYAVDVRLGPTPTFGTPVKLPITGYIQPLLRRNWDLTADGSRFVMLFRPGPQINLTTNWTQKVVVPASR